MELLSGNPNADVMSKMGFHALQGTGGENKLSIHSKPHAYFSQKALTPSVNGGISACLCWGIMRVMQFYIWRLGVCSTQHEVTSLVYCNSVLI